MIKLDTLYKRDKTGKKILVAEIEYGITNGTPDRGLFHTDTGIVTRTTGFIDGKKQKHTDTINVGKQNRTILEQAELEAKSHWNSKRDEGYKSFGDLIVGTRLPETASQKEYIDWLLKHLPIERTDASGVLKPMKCTATNDTKTGKLLPKVLAKIQYPVDVQPKLDGVRCFATLTSDGWKFTSSSGKPYDVVCKDIRYELEDFYGDIAIGTILDGELYIHGMPLEKISGWCRKQTAIEEHELLQFHIFDVPSPLTWEGRKADLEDMIPTEYNRDARVRFVTSITCETFEEVQEEHDRNVENGYEGAIIRNRKGKYAYGIRSAEIFKMKNFQDDEFEISGATLGKRGTFDMVFNMVTKDNKHFGAKPLGDAEKKDKYWHELQMDAHLQPIDRKVLGKMATVRYLNYSSYGIPVGNPVLKTIRDYE